MKIVVTPEILELNPGYAFRVGDEIILPDNVVPLGNEAPNTQTLDEDPPTGGERPPGGPRRP